MTIRVIQWATGPVGAAQLREIIDDPELELAGVFAYNPAKVGVDAGTLVSRPTTNIAVTNDRSAILALDADVVLHAASKASGNDANTDDIVDLLASGKNVITTTSYNHLRTYGAEAEQRITFACKQSGVRFHAAGEHPGFMFERLAVTLTGLSQRVDKITVTEFVDCSAVSEKTMLVDLMGMGKAPSEITVEAPIFRALAKQYEQSLSATADMLGLTIDAIHPAVQTATIDHPVPVAFGALAAGTVVGQKLSWTACRGDQPVLVAEENWTVTNDVADWAGIPHLQFLVRIRVDGSPPLRLDLTIDNDPVAELIGSSGGQLAVAMTAVRAIPYVLLAAPGVVTAPVFGAYRWR